MNRNKCWVWAGVIITVLIGGFYVVISNQLNQISKIQVYNGANVVVNKRPIVGLAQGDLIGQWQLRDWSQVNAKTDLAKLKITLAFEADSFRAKMCNTAGGDYTLRQDILKATGAMTEMFCEDETLMGVESALMAALAEGMRAQFQADTLILSSVDTGDDIFIFEKTTKTKSELDTIDEATELAT